MHVLDDTILRDRYDAVVVGAGIGGITAAALLAKQGLSTLLVEQHYLPGGVCSTVKRQGVAMDAGAALLFGFAPGSDSPHRYVMNVLEEDIDMIVHDSLYRMHFDGGRSVTFWRDFERYFAELTEAFPGKDEQFRGFYEESFKLYRAMNANPMPMSPDTTPRSEGLKMALLHPFRTRALLKSMDTPVKTVLDKYVKDPEVEGFFDLLIASCYCTPTSEIPLLLGTAVICSTHGEDGGACYPAGSPQALANKLEKALEKYDGQVLYRHMVEQILVEDGRARGIRLADGTEILADHVVCNADVYQLYGKLLPQEASSYERRAWAEGLAPSNSAVVLYLGVDAAAIPEGTHHIEAIISDVTVLESNNYFAYIPSIDEPSVAPEGIHSMSVLCSAGDYDWPRPGDPGYQGEEYQRQKQLAADRALDALEARLFPNLREHIRFLEVGTPSTIERFTLKSWGNIGGPKQMLGQHLFKRLGARTEIERLYCVGDSTSMGEGVVSVTASAVGAANMVLEDRDQPIYGKRRFDKEFVHYVEGAPRGPLPEPGASLTPDGARRLAIDCQWCEEPHCIHDCPAGVDVPGFIRRIDAGNYAGAARLVREANPLGGICGLACPAERLCERACTRRDYEDGPVRIAALQAWTCQAAGADGWPQESSESTGKRVAVVGAGPAGLSCAWFLARLGHEVQVYDPEPGGIPASQVPDFRVPTEVVEQEVASILGHERITLRGQRLGPELSLASLEAEHDAVFLAVGLGQGRTLEHEGCDRAQTAVSYLRGAKAGAEPLGGRVVVVGGGSVASDVAMMARRQGAEVTVVCLEALEDMPCLPSERLEMEEHGVEILAGWSLSRVEGDELHLVGCDAVLDEEGRFTPRLDPQRERTVAHDHLVLAVGQQLEDAVATQLSDEVGSILVESGTQRVLGKDALFAGGDLVRGGGTIVEAVADGRRAAAAVHAQLA